MTTMLQATCPKHGIVYTGIASLGIPLGVSRCWMRDDDDKVCQADLTFAEIERT